MNEWIKGLSGLETFYLICAVFGGAMFIIRTLLQFLGFHHGGMDGGNMDLSHTDAMGTAHDVDSDISFKFLSLQGLTAFFLMFGLVGLAIDRPNSGRELWSLFGGIAAGAITVWIMAKIFSLMKGLQSIGTFDIRNAMGQEGTVYLTIPSHEVGKVQMTVQSRLKVLDAVSGAREEIKTGERVKVISITSDNMLVVEKL